MGACSRDVLVGGVKTWIGSLLERSLQRSEAILSRQCERLSCAQKAASKDGCKLHGVAKSCMVDWSSKM